MLHADELADLRADFTDSLPDVAQIERKTPANTGRGRQTETWAVLTTTVCRIERLGTLREIVTADKVTAVAEFRASLPYGTDVTAKDRLVIGSITYEILGRVQNSSEEIGVEMFCNRVE